MNVPPPVIAARKQRALALLQRRPCTAAQAAEALGVSYYRAGYTLRQLMAERLVVRVRGVATPTPEGGKPPATYKAAPRSTRHPGTRATWVSGLL